MTSLPLDTKSGATTTAAPRSRRRVIRTPLAAYGEPMLWLTGGALALCVFMIIGLLFLIIRMGLSTFWPAAVVQVETIDGRVLMGEVTRVDRYTPDDSALAAMPDDLRERVERELEAEGDVGRSLVRTGNFDLTNTHFTWVMDAEVVDESWPEHALLLERLEWGRFYGIPIGFTVDGDVVVAEPGAIRDQLAETHDEVRDRWRQRRALQDHDLGELSRRREQGRLRVREVALDRDLPTAWARAFREVHEARVLANGDPEDDRFVRARTKLDRLESNGLTVDADDREAYAAALADYQQVLDENEEDNRVILSQIQELEDENARYAVVFRTASGTEKTVPVEQIVRAFAPNDLGFGDKVGVYLARWGEYLVDDPRAANSEGGVFPAIVGTVLMTMIMAVLVVPFGVMAALYLREYAKSGPVVSVVRIAINNLAGVPSIVFGVFGLGFFCYGVGGFIDGGPSAALPTGQWFGLLIGLTATAAIAFGASMLSLTRPGQPLIGRKKILRTLAGLLWFGSSLAAIVLIATTPFFDGFFRASLPNPTFGKGTLVWASFTLALLTLPVVIVATEEALSAVPNSMREGSYACGASKWQTIKRIVLPRAMPGIMTGMILAMARGAGEVAPLMLVGAVKLAPELPISLSPSESFGINRSFMHLGYHIYDLGFKSQNSEAAKPYVFTTTLLLVSIVAFLNLAAIWLRSRLKRKFVGMKF